MKLMWKFFVPIVIIVIGLSVLFGNPDKPFSATVPLVFGQYQPLIGGALIVVGVLVGVAILMHERKKS